MREIISKSARILSQTLIVMLCITFGVTGAVPVNQILSVYDHIAAKEEAAAHSLFIQSNPSDVDPQGDMSSTSKADAEQPCITAVTQAQSETFRISNNEPNSADGLLVVTTIKPLASSFLRTTASTISTSLGLQFRLLGEKPSGTS